MRRDINFFSVYRSPLDSDNGSDPILKAGIITISVCAAIVIGLTCCFKFNEHIISDKEKSINRYLAGSNISAAQNKIDQYSAKINAVNNYTNAIGSALKSFSLQPHPDSALLASIAKNLPSDVTVTNVSYTNSVIKLQCSCLNLQSAYLFVHMLKSDSRLSDISYSGVSFASAAYSFNVTCNVKEASAK